MTFAYYWSDEEKREGSERLTVYRACQERGHQPSGFRLMSNPPYDTCKFCGTAYRYEQVLRELDNPA